MKQKKESNGRREGMREERKKGCEEKNGSKTWPVLMVCHFCLVTSGLTGSTMSQNCHAYPQVLCI